VIGIWDRHTSFIWTQPGISGMWIMHDFNKVGGA
jgi:hypothetical protein